MKRWLLLTVTAVIALALGAGALAEAPEATPAPAGSLTLGDVSDTVRDLQTRLTLLGYYTGQLTGRYGERTRDAVQAFQADFGLAGDGVATEETIALAAAAQYRPQGYGLEGEDVRRTQKRLTQLGYYFGKLSGQYLDATADAVRAFQTKMGLPATGKADIATQEALFGENAVEAAAKAAATPAPNAENLLNAEDADNETLNVPFKKKLAKGSSNTYVKHLQQRLTDIGYYTGPISGNFASKTLAAVKEFQKQNGLEVTGTVGEETWNAVFNAEDLVLPAHTPRPTASPAPVAFHITVDVANQAVKVYARDENGEYNQLVRDMVCSSGTRRNPSDIGDWILNGRKTVWCYFPTWGDYARYWTRINSSIAFHSVIYNSVSTGDLRVKSYRLLGSRASHGCVRLLVSDAKWVYDYVGAGTVVTITDKLPADPELKASLKPPALNTKTMLPVATPRPTAEPVYISGAKPPLPLRALKKNDSGADVYWLQRKLTELGFYGGKCSGTYLDGTAAAVKAYQSAAGLRANGSADVATLEAIYRHELAPVATPTPVPTAVPTPEPTAAPTATPELIPTPEPLPETMPGATVIPEAEPAVTPGVSLRIPLNP